jgi:hypothetical protein
VDVAVLLVWLQAEGAYDACWDLATALLEGLGQLSPEACLALEWRLFQLGGGQWAQQQQQAAAAVLQHGGGGAAVAWPPAGEGTGGAAAAAFLAPEPVLTLQQMRMYLLSCRQRVGLALAGRAAQTHIPPARARAMFKQASGHRPAPGPEPFNLPGCLLLHS